MDEKAIQQARDISQEIIKNEFPEEEEYFDFLFDLTIQEIEELEPGKEAKFLREMRAAYPELVLGYAPIVFILTVQVLTEINRRKISRGEEKKEEMKDLIDKNIRVLLEDEISRRKLSGVSKYFEDI